MHRQEEAVERKLAEKDIELTKLMEEKKASKRYEIGEMEQKILFLSEKLISKQAVIERIESEKRSLELRLERAEVIFFLTRSFRLMSYFSFNSIK